MDGKKNPGNGGLTFELLISTKIYEFQSLIAPRLNITELVVVIGKVIYTYNRSQIL